VSRQLGEEQIITNIVACSKAVGGEKILSPEVTGNGIRRVKKIQKSTQTV